MSLLRLLFSLIGIIPPFLAFAQFTKTASCQSASFDKKVDSYLSYSAPVVSVKEAFAKKSDYIFLDAREVDEYNISHIPEARFIGYKDFNIKGIADIAKDSKIIVYCSIGYRSEKIATKLRSAGYKNVSNLYGSIFEWANMGYPISDKKGMPTSQVHTYNKKWSQWVTREGLKKTW